MTPEPTTPRRAVYLYAVVPADARVSAIEGVQDEPVEIWYGSGLGAATSEVDTGRLAAVTDESADPELLGALAQRHDAVVRAIAAEAGGALPFRLGTVLTGPDAVTGLLARRAAELREALERVSGCDEWGVRVRAGAGAGETAAPAGNTAVAGGPAAAQPGAGIAYLRQRQEQLARVQRREQETATLAGEVDRRLSEIAVDAVAGRGGTGVLLDRSYLVRRDDLEAFIAAVDEGGDRLAEAGHELRLNGPWPAYSFVALNLREGGDG